jgi:hypothetical protein
MSDTLANVAAAPVTTPSAPPAAASSPAPAPPQQQSAPAPAAAKPLPGSREFAELPLAQQHDLRRGPPNPRAQGYSPARDQREAAAARAAGEPDPAAPAPAADAPPADTQKFKVGKFETSEAELAAMLDRQAKDDLRAATVPPTPNDYKLELAPNTKLPGNVEYKFDTSDPGLAAAKAWAHSRGLDQSAFSEMLTIYASSEAQRNAVLAEISRAEIAKAGPNAPQRVDAVTRWITAEMGEADSKAIKATLVTDSHLRFYERLMQKVSSQGVASFSQQHRVAPDSDGIPGFEKMSFIEQRHAQDQLAARRGGR